MLVESDGLGTPEGPWEQPREWLTGVIRTFSKSVSPVVLKQSSPGAQAGWRARLTPRLQAANSILSSGYFCEEPSSSPILVKSVSSQDGFKLQPNLAPSSHTVFFSRSQ